jgi:MFS family permease
MAVLMIPCSKLSDRWGRKRCFIAGLIIYGIGALLSAAAPGLGVLVIGNSILEGVGTALLIPPVYILATLHFGDLTSRAKAFGVISGLGGIGAAAGPLIGGLITSAISWRAAFVFQALIILLIVAGVVFLTAFFVHIRRAERAGGQPLLSTGLFRHRVSNLALVTQNLQWLLLMGVSFVVAVFLQTVRGYDAIQTGVIFTAATLGVLVSSLAAERLARRFNQRTLIITGFVLTAAGIGILLALVGASSRVIAFGPGLLLIGLGLGTMLTPSVNIVQSSFAESEQGEISGLSRSVSNLGSSFGTAIAGTILVSDLASGNTSYVVAMIVLAAFALVGLAVSLRLPRSVDRAAATPVRGEVPVVGAQS